MAKRTSLKDIAQHVGVSSALVSYVLNEKNTGRISKAMTQRIKDAARELDYRTNFIAKSLKTSKTQTIGFMVPDISGYFSSALARIIEDEASKENYTVLFGSSDENAGKFEAVLDTFLQRNVDGLIITPGKGTIEQIKVLQKHQVPFVLIDRYFPELETNYVALNNFEAAFNATKHLVDCGHEQIAFINYESPVYNMQERNRGYTEALQQLQHRHASNLLCFADAANLFFDVRKAIDALMALPQPPDAVIFGSNEIALEAVLYIKELKIKVPEDLAIVSFDERAAWELFYAPLTHIRQPLQEMGKKAMEILLAAIDNPALPPQQVQFPSTLIVRESTCPRKK